MSYELEGVLFVKEDTNVISDKFQKREFVVMVEKDVNGQIYTDHLKLQLKQDKCDLLNDYKTGQQIKVSFNISGKPWEKDGVTKYFSNLDAWKIEKVAGAEYPTPTPEPQIADNKPDNDVLPF